MHNLFYRNINFDSEKQSILHNLNLLNHLQNKFIKMKVYVVKEQLDPHLPFKQVTDDLSIKEYQQGDEIKGFVTISNNSKEKLKFEMFSTFLYGEVTVVRDIGDKYRHVFLKMIDLESSLSADTDELDCDGYVYGLPKNKTLLVGRSYKIPFKFVLPDTLLDTSCESEVSTHLKLPPSFGISKDSSGWFGNIPDKGYVCHDLSTLHSSTSHYGNISKDKSDENLYMKGGDGIFTNDLCPSGVAVSYGVESVLIGSSEDSNFNIINDAKHQLRVIPHYVDSEQQDSSFESLSSIRDDYFSLENLRNRYEVEITRLETIINENLALDKKSSDEDKPHRKVRSLRKEKQLELAEWNRKISDDIVQEWNSSSFSHKRQMQLKINELKHAQKKYLSQQLKSFDNSVCSIVNFLTKSANNSIINEINAINKANPTLFTLEKLNHFFIDQYSRSSFLKISCPSLNFDLMYKSPLSYKMAKVKNIWNMISEKKKNQSLQQQQQKNSETSNDLISIDSIDRTIELDLEFVSIKSNSPSDDYQKPPRVKKVKVSLCSLTIDSKHPIPISLRCDMFLNATNENVDLNNSNNFADSSRKLFSFSKHNNTGISQEFRNYKQRLLKISKELDMINAGKPKNEEVIINPNIVKSLNSLLTLRVSKAVIEEEFEVKNFKVLNPNWEIFQHNAVLETKLIFQNKLSIDVNIDNASIKETLIPTFQNCLIARLYCYKIELEFDDDEDVGSNGYNKKRGIIYVPVEIK